jgi:hypothetical protein
MGNCMLPKSNPIDPWFCHRLFNEFFQ